MNQQPAVSIRIQQLENAHGLPLPEYETAQAAGMDLRAAVSEIEPDGTATITLQPGDVKAIPTGIAISLPAGFEGQVRARSGLALKHGLAVLNAPGTIDADYRGEIRVILANLGREPVTITRGQRIAQLVIAPVARVTWQRVALLEGTERGAGGFGSTGNS